MYSSEFVINTYPSHVTDFSSMEEYSKVKSSTKDMKKNKPIALEEIGMSVPLLSNHHAYSHSQTEEYPTPNLEFAPPAHEVLYHSQSIAQSHVEPKSLYKSSHPIQYQSVQTDAAPINRYPVNFGDNNLYTSHVAYSSTVSNHPVNMNTFQAAPTYVNQEPYSLGFSLAQTVSPNRMAMSNQMSYSNPRQESLARSQPSKTKSFKNDYLHKRIENDLIKRTECIGNIQAGAQEFDDYFETHVEKFFTPELHQFTFYHDNLHIYGMQMEYRDPWGKLDKETYKGQLHMSKNISPKSCTYSTFNLDFDEYLTELYVDGQDEITYFKLVTNERRVFELGCSDKKETLKNLVVPLTRVMGSGGSYDIYLKAIYFYYN